MPSAKDYASWSDERKKRHAEYNKRWWADHGDKLREKHQRKRARLRRDVYNAYGGACAECGDTNWCHLQLHHVNNDGAEDRKKYQDIWSFYYNLKANNYPPTIELLCANCHLDRHCTKDDLCE